ncbi:pseudouridine synthase [Dasania marina]|uniref:pseudouridine synthase n=1 Tax=Dasania marina TaxID=471499 RepID=UPI0030DD3A5C|tara:strand:+ start:62064 stop:62735 length:672 start_codon:yes stop_codon:yes gene_type:complete
MQPQADPFIVPKCHDDIKILYQDEHLLLINKPTGLLSLSGKHPLNKDSVHFRLVQDFPTATLVHRLDFGTSGIMLVALNKAINAQLTKQFQVRTVSKRYTAVLHGHLADEQGTIEFPIAKDKPNFPLQKICFETGKLAQTNYQVMERCQGPATTKVSFMPVSGRTHQLRIHSREIGHPILGCDLYATDEAFFMADRLMLHATTLTFDHPITGERVEGLCPCPF